MLKEMFKKAFSPQYVVLVRPASAAQPLAGLELHSRDGDVIPFEAGWEHLPVLASLWGFGPVEELADHLDGLQEFTGAILDIEGPPDLSKLEEGLDLDD